MDSVELARQTAAELHARLAAAGADRACTVDAALDAALAQAQAGDRVLVFGSFHTAAAAVQRLNGG